MDKTDRIYKILRNNLDAAQAKSVATRLDTRWTDEQVEDIEKFIAEAKVSVISPARVKEIPVEAVDLASKLRDYIVAEQPYREREYDETRWAKEIQRITAIHETITYPVIEVVMKWVFEFDSDQSNFWKEGNIASAGKFRKQFTTLVSQAKKELSSKEIQTVG